MRYPVPVPMAQGLLLGLCSANLWALILLMTGQMGAGGLEFAPHEKIRKRGCELSAETT